MVKGILLASDKGFDRVLRGIVELGYRIKPGEHVHVHKDTEGLALQLHGESISLPAGYTTLIEFEDRTETFPYNNKIKKALKTLDQKIPGMLNSEYFQVGEKPQFKPLKKSPYLKSDKD